MGFVEGEAKPQVLSFLSSTHAAVVFTRRPVAKTAAEGRKVKKGNRAEQSAAHWTLRLREDGKVNQLPVTYSSLGFPPQRNVS